MRFVSLGLLATLAIGCATSSEFVAPDGRQAHLIRCDFDRDACPVKAGDICKTGYHVYQQYPLAITCLSPGERPPMSPEEKAAIALCQEKGEQFGGYAKCMQIQYDAYVQAQQARQLRELEMQRERALIQEAQARQMQNALRGFQEAFAPQEQEQRRPTNCVTQRNLAGQVFTTCD